MKQEVTLHHQRVKLDQGVIQVIQYKGGNGSSKQEAVIILGAESELEGVDAEYEYIESLCEHFELDSQTFLEKGNEKYDILTVKLPGGTKKDIYFDITDFYGREDD